MPAAATAAVATIRSKPFTYITKVDGIADIVSDRCIYGHRCQAPKCNDPLKWPNEKKTCIFGPDCVFPAELHNIDLVPVKMTKV